MPEPTTQEVKAVAKHISTPAWKSPTVWIAIVSGIVAILIPRLVPAQWQQDAWSLWGVILASGILGARKVGIDAAATTAGMTPGDVSKIAENSEADAPTMPVG